MPGNLASRFWNRSFLDQAYGTKSYLRQQLEVRGFNRRLLRVGVLLASAWRCSGKCERLAQTRSIMLRLRLLSSSSSHCEKRRVLVLLALCFECEENVGSAQDAIAPSALLLCNRS